MFLKHPSTVFSIGKALEITQTKTEQKWPVLEIFSVCLIAVLIVEKIWDYVLKIFHLQTSLRLYCVLSGFAMSVEKELLRERFVIPTEA